MLRHWHDVSLAMRGNRSVHIGWWSWYKQKAPICTWFDTLRRAQYTGHPHYNENEEQLALIAYTTNKKTQADTSPANIYLKNRTSRYYTELGAERTICFPR